MSSYLDGNLAFRPMAWELPLIHITSDFDIIKNILKEGFRPSYCTEYLSNNEREIRAAFPMVSFCNMNIDESQLLLKSYGTLAISMKKTWGEKNNLSPVLYLERNSSFTNHIINSFEEIKHFTDQEIQSCLRGGLIGQRHILVKTLLELFFHAKNYDGLLVRNGYAISDKYPFGLEREWRYLLAAPDELSYLIGEEIDSKKEYNKKIEKYRLKFDSDDVHSFTLETDWEEKELREIWADKFQNKKNFPKVYINETRWLPDE